MFETILHTKEIYTTSVKKNCFINSCLYVLKEVIHYLLNTIRGGGLVFVFSDGKLNGQFSITEGEGRGSNFGQNSVT